jgi:hypothetical protein
VEGGGRGSVQGRAWVVEEGIVSNGKEYEREWEGENG